jgi:GT2 family glycosyltransferase
LSSKKAKRSKNLENSKPDPFSDKKRGSMCLVSIIITHYGDIEYLQGCLNSIIENTEYPHWEIIIINNSGVKVKDLIVGELDKIKVYDAPRNLGYAGSVNTGAKIAKGKILIILNNDVEVGKKWLLPLVNCLQKDDSIAGCQGKILSLRDRSEFDYAGAAGGAIDIFGYPFCRGRIFDTIEKDYGQYDQLYEPFWICGVCMAIKRDALEKIGYFDEVFFMYGEEVDWCWRAQLLGYRFMFVPDSLIYHLGSGNTQKWPSHKKVYYLHRNHLYILIKNHSLKDLLFVLPVRILMDVTASLYYLSKGNLLASLYTFKAIGWIIINFKTVWEKRKAIQKAKMVAADKTVKKGMLKIPIVFLYFIQKKRCFTSIFKNETNTKSKVGKQS